MNSTPRNPTSVGSPCRICGRGDGRCLASDDRRWSACSYAPDPGVIPPAPGRSIHFTCRAGDLDGPAEAMATLVHAWSSGDFARARAALRALRRHGYSVLPLNTVDRGRDER